MFDEVNYKMHCPICSGIVENFQTKDRPQPKELSLQEIRTVKVDGDKIQNFYSECDICDALIDVKVQTQESLSRELDG